MSRWLLFFLFISPGAAAREPYGLALVDELKALDRAGLERTAAPLIKRGAAVAVVLVRHGSRDDAVKQLAQLGLLDHNQIAPKGLLIYVSLSPRYSELRAGPDWSDLTPARLDEIREGMLNPSLREGGYQHASEQSLTAMESRLAGGHRLKNMFLVIAAVMAFQLILNIDGHSPLNRMLTDLWNFTPMGRRQLRLAQQRDLERRMEILRAETANLRNALKSTEALAPDQKSRVQAFLDSLEQPDAEKLEELTAQTRAQIKILKDWSSTWSRSYGDWREAAGYFGKLRSRLKERKKTRHLMQIPEFLSLKEGFTAEEAIINGYLRAGVDESELTSAAKRWKKLRADARNFQNRYLPEQAASKPAPAKQSFAITDYGGSSSSDYSPAPSSSNNNSYEPSYEPPSSPASESWSGGDW